MDITQKEHEFIYAKKIEKHNELVLSKAIAMVKEYENETPLTGRPNGTIDVGCVEEIIRFVIKQLNK